MIRRTLNIMVVFVLSLMIIGASTGISFVRCCHSGMVEIAQLSAMEDGADCGMPMSSDCMQLTVLKLAPTNVAQQPAFDFTQLYHQVALPAFTVHLLPCVHVVTINRPLAFADYHSPPRAYLRLLCQLLI